MSDFILPGATPPPKKQSNDATSSAKPQVTAFTELSSLAAMLAAWQEHLRKSGLSPNTIKNYAIDIKLLIDFVGPGVAIGGLTTNTLNEYIDWMRYRRGKPCSDKTADRRITALKSFYRWASAAAKLKVNPAEDVVNISVRSPLPKVLTPAEIESALTAAMVFRGRLRKPDIRPWILFTLVLETALRKGEVTRLVPNHLNLEDEGDYHLYVRYSDKRHRYKERKIPLSDAWVEDFKTYRETYNLSEKIFPWSVRRLEYLLQDIAKEARLKHNISFDTLRWTSALRMYRSGLEPEPLRRRLGLSKIQWNEVRAKLKKLDAL